MCGILGWYRLNNKPFTDSNRNQFQSALDTIKHRGPDAGKTLLVNDTLLFGHRRLSIIDLAETNNQPFISHDGRYVLIYNGEIFNYKEIRDQLISKQYSFVTEGDTEVLLHAYDLWGEDCVNHFNGMWAFVIFDCKKNKLFASRDRFGIKPFNYHLNKEEFIFASEAKPILKLFSGDISPNYTVIGNFLTKTVGGQLEDTWFEGIKRLMPAHNLVIENGKVHKYRYWQYPLKTNTKIRCKDAIEEYLYLLEDAVNLRMRSDVPVGTTLSSGLDSSSIVALMRRFYDGEHNTYTAYSNQKDFHKLENTRFNKDVSKDESSIVKQLTNSLNLKANFIATSHSNYLNQLKQLIYFLEAPHHSQSIVPLHQVLQKAKKNVTVILEGQGADELLGGYIARNAFAFSVNQLKKNKPVKAFKNIKSFGKHYSLNQGLQLYIRSLDNQWTQQLFQKKNGYQKLFQNQLQRLPILKDQPFEPPAFDCNFNKFLYTQHTGTLVDLLHYGDRISMANSLESRLPFMDYRLVEFGFSLPAEMKVRGGLGKYIHRAAMRKVLPDYIVNNPYKFGFTTPLAKIFMEDGEGTTLHNLKNGSVVERGLINIRHLERMIAEHKEEKVNHSRLLYRLVGVELWFNQFIN